MTVGEYCVLFLTFFFCRCFFVSVFVMYCDSYCYNRINLQVQGWCWSDPFKLNVHETGTSYKFIHSG